MIKIKEGQFPVLSRENHLVLVDYDGKIATLGCYGCKNLLELTVNIHKGSFTVQCNWCGDIVAKNEVICSDCEQACGGCEII